MGILTFEGSVCHASSCVRHFGVLLNTLLLRKGEGEGSSSPSPCTSLYSSLLLVLFIRFQACLNFSKASSSSLTQVSLSGTGEFSAGGSFAPPETQHLEIFVVATSGWEQEPLTTGI